MSSNKSRHIIEGRARDMVVKVHKYFEKERDICKQLILRLSALEKGRCNVVVPIKIFNDVIEYLKASAQVTNRVVSATEINKNSLTRIRREAEEAKANNTVLRTPVKKPRGKKKFLGKEEYVKLRNTVTDYIEKKRTLKFPMLLTYARQELGFKGSITTLKKIVWGMGYKKNKIVKKAVVAKKPPDTEKLKHKHGTALRLRSANKNQIVKNNHSIQLETKVTKGAQILLQEIHNNIKVAVNDNADHDRDLNEPSINGTEHSDDSLYMEVEYLEDLSD